MNQASPSSERDLVARLRDRDERAYAQLYRDHKPRMLAVARRLLRNEADAEEAVQEAFLRAYRGFATFQGNAALGTWLYRIVSNTAAMELRSAARRRRLAARAETTWSTAEPSVETPEEVAAQRSDGRSLDAALSRLPAHYRQVIRQRDLSESTTAEAARILDVSPGCIRTRLHRARHALRAALAGEGTPNS